MYLLVNIFLCFVSLDGYGLHQLSFVLQVQRTIYWEPLQLSKFLAVQYEQLDACQVSNCRIVEIYEEVEVVPDVVILIFMFLEAILLTVENLDIHTTDIALGLFVFSYLFVVLSDLSKLIDDNGSKNLLNDDFYHEQVQQIEYYLYCASIDEDTEDCAWVIVITDDAWIRLKTIVKSKEHASCQAATTMLIFCIVHVIEVHKQNVVSEEIDEQHDQKLEQ